MKKRVYIIAAIIAFGFSSATVFAQNSEEEVKKVKIEIVVEENGETKKITKEIEVPKDIEVHRIIKEMKDMHGNFDHEDIDVQVRTYQGDKEMMRLHREMMEQKKGEKVAFMGVVGYTTNANGEGDHRVRLTRIVKDGPAEKAGLKNEDILKSFDGTELESYKTLVKLIREKKIGDRVDVVVERDGKLINYTITLAEHEVKAYHREHIRRMHGNPNMNIRVEVIVDDLSESEMSMLGSSLGMTVNDETKLESQEIEIFPNPVENEFEYSIKLEDGGKLEVKLLDSSGKEITSDILKNSEGIYKGNFSLKDQPSGSYFLVFSKDSKVLIEKIIKS